jgi:ATP-dependent Clp protease ATP-binding subunit ClpA
MRPNLGFAASDMERKAAAGEVDDDLNAKVARAGVEAARRKFTPEFMNRIDKVVVFRPLGTEELNRVLSIELNMLQQRIFNSPDSMPFVLNVTADARDYLLREGTDMKYGARHLKRAIERTIVQPLSNLIASGQVRGGDLLRIDFDAEEARLDFIKDAEDMPTYAMMQMTEPQVSTLAVGAGATLPKIEPSRTANAKTQKNRF